MMPEICCITELPLSPRINDRRNLIEAILESSWGPVVIIKDVIEKIPSFLVNNRLTQKTV